MKRNIKHLVIMISACFTIASCNGDFLNTEPLTEISESQVWSDPALAEAFVTGIYQGLGNGGFNEEMLASFTDEAIFTHPGRGITTVTEARVNPADVGWNNTDRRTWNWQRLYSYIRRTNLAIDELSEPQFPNDGGIVDRLMGEALFMRAYYYHDLARYFGGVPLVERPYELGEESYTLPRATYEETINFIISDLDEAASLLAGKSMVDGRTSELAALALKSRVLLYAASDLHDAPTAQANSSLLAGYGDIGLLAYTSGNQTERWQKAQAAAMEVIQKGSGNLYGLSEPVSHEEGIQNYINNSLSRNGGENELIFARYFINMNQEDGGRQGLYNGPNGYNNWAGNTPVQLLVDDYEMMDGTEFDWSNPDHASSPYENRDARFYASILYDGAQWKPRSTANQPKDPLGQIQTGTYEVVDGSGDIVPHFGLDTRNSSIEDWNGSYTGYYVRKFIDPDPAIVDQNTWQEVPWPFLRYTEAVLNYVEASLELGQEDVARDWLNQIRFRVGQPAITESGEALMERYRNERRIEMAYEEQRFHDVRRWMVAEETFGRQANIVSITGTLKPGETLSTYRYDPEIYDYEYVVQPIDPGKENRLWLDKMYFTPIHRDEMNRNSELIQNPGFE
ncbi:RagB/SusD family nutrient uptake outer membrane protein [Algoriphagus halophytocola]|uniref:RagB/SusD family nutrient uptake outer membrane protein n=1 Tax=Algoriphagus halophytocola TaxID=2991499 RepID=A0ABY6MCC4_9BACT|nr:MULTISPECIES: RagB/SusD family nutrient uptake outer membrane protein [unclassified Algoriphagus]UZD21317.1 RagB/SusD family nutrient uptake outer membrane protein [Algoriphagus sp. TR-M5]WBL42528.1 RagB/SusD family nutrient uptake outer membrane protein [Algoriphagus sp. TR-M9]